MSVKQLVEHFQQIPPSAQVVLIVFALVVVVLLVTYSTVGTSIIAFLVTLKMLATQR